MTETRREAKRKPQIFADSSLLLEIQAFEGRRKPQTFAENPQETADWAAHWLEPLASKNGKKPGRNYKNSTSKERYWVVILSDWYRPIRAGPPARNEKTVAEKWILGTLSGISKPGEPVVCTLDSRGFRHFRGFRDFRESCTQLLVCSCLSCLRHFRHFREFRRFRERRPARKP